MSKNLHFLYFFVKNERLFASFCKNGRVLSSFSHESPRPNQTARV